MISSEINCPICGNAFRNRLFYVSECQFGILDRFPYVECASCKSLSLLEVPTDWSKYYPADYYSFSLPRHQSISPWLKRIRGERTRVFLGRQSIIGYFLSKISKRLPYFDYFSGLRLDVSSRIVDIGCGAGALLNRMKRDGFCCLEGLDPHVSETLELGDGLIIRKAGIEALTGEYDLIMLHHSFEHMEYPREVLAKLAKHLANSGSILIRVPVTESFAWRKYGANWVSLDAPRHIHLYSPQAIVFLANLFGLEVTRTWYDSGSRQFYGSELYARQLSLVEHESHLRSYFSQEELDAFQVEADKLNLLRDGDTACFVLTRK